jgi:hypothetical protein
MKSELGKGAAPEPAPQIASGEAAPPSESEQA